MRMTWAVGSERQPWAAAGEVVTRRGFGALVLGLGEHVGHEREEEGEGRVEEDADGGVEGGAAGEAAEEAEAEENHAEHEHDDRRQEDGGLRLACGRWTPPARS